MPIIGGGGSGGGGGSTAPGFEIGYTQITTNANVLSTAEATGTTIISPGALVFDGGPVMVEFWAIAVTWDSAAVQDVVIVSLFEGATQIARLSQSQTKVTSATLSELGYGRLRFTPTAASHTYTVTAFASSTTGTPKIVAGAGGAAVYPPAFVRFTKV